MSSPPSKRSCTSVVDSSGEAGKRRRIESTDEGGDENVEGGGRTDATSTSTMTATATSTTTTSATAKKPRNIYQEERAALIQDVGMKMRGMIEKVSGK